MPVLEEMVGKGLSVNAAEEAALQGQGPFLSRQRTKQIKGLATQRHSETERSRTKQCPLCVPPGLAKGEVSLPAKGQLTTQHQYLSHQLQDVERKHKYSESTLTSDGLFGTSMLLVKVYHR